MKEIDEETLELIRKLVCVLDKNQDCTLGVIVDAFMTVIINCMIQSAKDEHDLKMMMIDLYHQLGNQIKKTEDMINPKIELNLDKHKHRIMNEKLIEQAKEQLEIWGTLSIPFLQRKFKINYTTASKLYTLLVR